ncbi:EF-hand domain-containing protein [Streptomyces sp. NPDC050504]|uniref:EF-hand domain-containing protein n=1 Tax=Streptomyces sp. NPDC050504 TaxID=3365618 RepID=UPI0037A03D60
MPADLLARKIGRHFDLFDTNGDGRISQEDFDLVVARLAREFDQTPQSPKYQALSKAYREVWEAMRDGMDTDGDGSISREEYVAALRSDAQSDPAYWQLILPAAKAVVDLCDINGDGRLDQAELAKAHIGLGMVHEDHETAMARIDHDGDGYISVEELAVAIEEFFRSQSEDASGNWLFGKY